ncbi:MAG: iron ABC transporter permease [Syntrophorhabdaceae bacterium]|nr:iron ABC transporter permease [Syntrophorhabdaceae bacterium]
MKKLRLTYFVLFLLLFFSILLSLGYGKGFKELFNGLLGNDGFAFVLKKIRIPRTILALFIGGSLSISGATLQSILRNNLAEPYTLGISGGASFGITLSVILGLNNKIGSFANPLMGFLGAMCSTYIVFLLSRRRFFDANNMVLFGIVISLIFSSLVFFLFSISDPDRMHGVILWLMGDLSGFEIEQAFFFIPVFLISAAILFYFNKELDVLTLGHEKARYVGVNPDVMYKLFFTVTSVLTGICVSIAGIIGFVGLIVPHILKIFLGTGSKHILFTSYLLGASFLTLSDTFSRYILYPVELPVGVFTGISGGIILLILLLKR